MEDVDSERLVRVYRKIRAARSELAKKFKTEDDKLKSQLDTVGNAMLSILIAFKQESVRTAEGTFYKQIETKPIGSDWGAFYSWVAEDPERFEFLERRIKVTEVVDYMKTHTETDADGNVRPLLPPGVSINQEWVIRVRKANDEGDE
jgi:hypothetical protein